MTDNTASSDDPGQQGPIITDLEGFPNPVRHPDTGMIIPQSRKERRALEHAQEQARQRQAEKQRLAEMDQEEPKSQTVAPPEDSAKPVEDAGAEDLESLESEVGLETDAAGDYDEIDEEPAADAFVISQAPVESETLPPPTPAQAVTGEQPIVEPVVDAEPPAKKTSRAGRNLPAAIGTGAVLLGAAIVGIFWFPLVLAILVATLVLLGTWELRQVMKRRNIDVALIPLWVAALALPATAYFAGIDAMVFALFGTLILAVFWIAVGDSGRPMVSMMGTVYILMWVPFLLSFAVVLMREPHGNWMFLITILLAVANDTFGYIFGILWGKHPMAPKISPKKSWEGFIGSLLGAIAVGIASVVLILDYPWWIGPLLGVLIVFAATAGDFAASMFKRDMGVKDMGNTLPGHGGVMDRLDSIAFASPVAFTIFVVVMP